MILTAQLATEDQSDAMELVNFASPCRAVSEDVVNISIDALAAVKPRILVAVDSLPTKCASEVFSWTQVRYRRFLAAHHYAMAIDYR